MAAGLGFKTFTSGEVLTAADTNGYLMQGILVFANASARTAAITSPQEGQFSYLKDTNSTEYYDGSAWVAGVEGDISGVTAGTGISGGGTSGTVTVTNSMATTITTKGDLVPGTGSGTFARLAVGNNGETLVADSSTSTGLRYQANTSAGKNAVYNSATEIWQRGTTFTNTVGYTADRWYQAAANVTTTQETTIVPTGFVTSIKGTTTASSQPYWLQALETKDSIRFAGQTATISVYGATSDNSNMFLRLDYSTSTDNAALGTWTTIATTNISASSTIARLASVSFAVPSTAKSLRIITGASGSIASGATVTFTGVQMEVGSVATAFARQSGTIQGELAACQRYYFRTTASAAYSSLTVTGQGNTTQIADCMLPVPVTMRTYPTSVDYANVALSDEVAGTYTGGTLSISSSVYSNQYIPIRYTHGSAALTTYRVYKIIANNNSSAYVGVSAEL